MALDDPSNGMITCMLGADGIPSAGDNCTLTCNNGYEIRIGDSMRTCLSTGIWSGSDAMCTRGNLQIFAYLLTNKLFQLCVQHSIVPIMEQSIVHHWEMMEFLPMKTLVISHVTLVMS